MLDADSNVPLILTLKKKLVQFILICLLSCSKCTEMQSRSFRKSKKLEAPFNLILLYFQELIFLPATSRILLITMQ